MNLDQLTEKLSKLEEELKTKVLKYKYAEVGYLQNQIKELKKRIKKMTPKPIPIVDTKVEHTIHDNEISNVDKVDRNQTNNIQSKEHNHDSLSISERFGPSDMVWDLIVNEKKKGNYDLCLDLYKQLFMKYKYDEIGCNAYSGLAKIYFLLNQYENAKLCYMAAINEFCDSIDRELIQKSSDKQYPNIIVLKPYFFYGIYTQGNELRPIDFNNESYETKEEAYNYCMNKKLLSFSYSYLFSEKIQATAGVRGIVHTTLRHFGLCLLIEENNDEALLIAEEYRVNHSNFTGSFTMDKKLFEKCVMKALDTYNIKTRTQWIEKVYNLLGLSI